jgi:hypothetical protein
MAVERTYADYQTRYELHDEAGLSCVLTYTAEPDEPATWMILLPGPAAPRTSTAPSGFLTRMLPASRPGSAPSSAANTPPNSPTPSMPYRRRRRPGGHAARPPDHLPFSGAGLAVNHPNM